MNSQQQFDQLGDSSNLQTEIALLFIEQQPLSLVFEKLGQLLFQQIGLSCVALYQFEDASSAKLKQYHATTSLVKFAEGITWQHGFLDWYERLDNGQVVNVNIDGSDNHRATFLRQVGISSATLCPIQVHNHWNGFILFGSHEDGRLGHQRYQSLFKAITEMCGKRINAQQQHDQRHESLTRAQALERITHSFNQHMVDSQSIETALAEVRETFSADRAWLLNPSLINDKQAGVAYEVSAPAWPGSKTLNEPLSIDDEIVANLQRLEGRELPIAFGGENEFELPAIALRYGVQAQLVMLLKPTTGEPWVIGLDHCRSQRNWTNNEHLLFRDIGHRITEHLSQNLLLQQIAENENKFRTLFDETPAIFVTLNHNHRITSINNHGCHLLAQKSSRLKGKKFLDLFAPKFREPVVSYLEWAGKDEAHGSPDWQSTEAMLAATDGRERWLKITARRISEKDVADILIVAEDITAQRRLTEALAQQAQKDPLTGLANRREFRAQLENAFEARGNNNAALCYIDLNEFKSVNDTFGHEVGDGLLEKLGKLLRQATRDSDVVARLGGDEFCLLARDIQAKSVKALANNLAQRISGKPITIGQQQFNLSASMGVALSSSDDETPAEWLRRADAACYYAKSSKSWEPAIFEDLPEEAQRSMTKEASYWEDLIKQVLKDNSFTVDLQPIMDTRTNTPSISHYEALLRLPSEHQELKVEDFFQHAKRANLAREVDYWMLKTVVSALAHDSSIGIEASHVSVNISTDTLLHPELGADIQRLVKEYGVTPQRLCIEIKENDILTHFNTARDLFNELANAGVKFCIDHFGHNLQAIMGLQKLPFDYIKLDAHLIDQIDQKPVNAAVISAILKVSRMVGARTIAGHVEHQADLKALQKLGVDYAQGFVLGKPEPMHQKAARIH